MTGEPDTVKGDPQEHETIPTGTGGAGRMETQSPVIPEKEYPRRRSVKARKRRKGHRHRKNACGVAGNGRLIGQHVPRGSCEAGEILKNEGWTVGKVLDPTCPFDLIGWSHTGSILVRIARPKGFASNAHSIRNEYEAVIREMEIYYRSESDNLQFWVISREYGLLRYRVCDWGIGNVGTMQKITRTPRELPSDNQTAGPEPANRRVRNSPCPDGATGLDGAPDATPLHSAIPS